MRLVLLALLGLTTYVLSQAPEAAMPPAALRSVESFGIHVDVIHPGTVSPPINKNEVKDQTDHYLRSRGIVPKEATPTLFVIVRLVPVHHDGKLGGYAYASLLTLKDMVTLRDGQPHYAHIWTRWGSTFVRSQDVKQRIIEDLTFYLTRFADAWLKAHPKRPAASATP